MMATRRPGARGGERGALAGQSGADDEDVVCGHGGRVYIGYGPLRRPERSAARPLPEWRRRGRPPDASTVGAGRGDEP